MKESGSCIKEKGVKQMAELEKCPNCNEYINLEIDVYRDDQGFVYCNKCNALISNN